MTEKRKKLCHYVQSASAKEAQCGAIITEGHTTGQATTAREWILTHRKESCARCYDLLIKQKKAAA